MKETHYLCVIPARSGSRRIPGKNFKLFHGKPIVYYSIELALQTRLFQEIVVSVDNVPHYNQVKHDWKDFPTVTPEFRSAHLANDEAGTQAVAEHHLHQARLGMERVLCLYATAPMATVSDIKKGLAMFSRFPSPEFVYPVGPDGKDAGQWYWSNAISLINKRELDVAPTFHLEIPASRVIDINTPEDWAQAEEMFRYGGITA